MKFSFPLLKKLIPTVKSKKELIEKLNFYFFEAEDAVGDTLDISIPSNRYSDAASHLGIAAEVSAISGVKFKEPEARRIKPFLGNKFTVSIKEPKLCWRASARYLEGLKIGPSPKWIQKVLKDCGMRPINNLVDITNYVMLETGQPLHAFDFDKMEGGKLIIRRAKQGEKLITLDNKKFILDNDILVLADEKDALDIAGTKGGKKAEITAKTKNILLTACNFNPASIYKTTRRIKLETEASALFSHGLSPALVERGINRATELIVELCKGKLGQVVDVGSVKPRKKIIKFDVERFNKLIGADLDVKTCRKCLELLGFKMTQNSKLKTQNSFLVEVPLLRDDIELFEDLAEEVVRLYGYNRLKSQPPHIHLVPSGFEDQIVLKDKTRKILTGIGLNEVSNYSFIGDADMELISVSQHENRSKSALMELENPTSSQFKYLRSSLSPHLLENIKNNFRFFDEVKIFEIGKIFFKDNKNKLNEKLTLGIALASKNNKQTFFELKGAIREFFGKIGLVDYFMPEMDKSKNFLQPNEILKIESSKTILGYLGGVKKNFVKGDAALAEIDLDELLKLVSEEHEYQPLPKYPSVMRDISILVEPTRRIGEITQVIQETNLKYIEDVDLIDEYDFEGKRSLSFRIIFQAKDQTLTDKEVNQEMEKIIKILKSRFKIKVR